MEERVEIPCPVVNQVLLPREGDQNELFMDLKFLLIHTDLDLITHSCDSNIGVGPNEPTGSL